MNYLDVNKSVIISSPAGSGKTEKLARRYISLLRSGVDVERILAITFTDKAAAEMKQRILRILREEDEDLFKKLLDKMPLMRVSTIHSFCGTLLRRFSFEALIDPNYRIEDSVDSRITWDEIIYEILMEAGEGKAGQELLLDSIGEKGFRGLEYLKTTINGLFDKRPFSLEAEIPVFASADSRSALIEELKKWPGAKKAIEDYEGLFEEDAFYRLVSFERHFLTQGGMPRKKIPPHLKVIADYQDWALKMWQYLVDKKIKEHTKSANRIKEIFIKCFNRYSDKKALKGSLDFSDLEYITFRLLTENPEWANILYAFDEKTDHILVDEFQDTNNFQWAVIDKLTEEWRSGLGAKREEDIMPTIFLVGDEKQSIYLFRGANVEIFHRARKKMNDWLRDEFYYEEVKENFRSRSAIIDFTNYVFSRIMKSDEFDPNRDKGDPSWVTRYSPFQACRKDSNDTGKVELILLDDDVENTAKAKQKEADIIAKRIQGLVRGFQITEKASSLNRQCRYMDIALLLRRRTHLKRYEDAFRKFSIPFVAVKGIGFYQEPEVAILRALVYFLSNSKDDYSLYVLLKSPFFLADEGVIIRAMSCKGESLYEKLKACGLIKEKMMFIDELLLQAPYSPVSELVEKALVSTKAWEYFYEPQRKANVKKFIRLVEDLEADGKSLLKIRDFLEMTEGRADEPKANVNIEGMDAVRIMTIHGSKGLEFPIVIVPGIEEPFTSKTNDSLIYDHNGNIFFKYMPEPAIRKLDKDFQLYLKKEKEEQKRLFYVAVTRAEEALFLVGRWSGRDDGFIGFLKQGLGLENGETGFRISASGTKEIHGLSILSEKEVDALYERAPKPEKPELYPAPAGFINIEIEKAPQWKAVTEVINISRKHGKDWLVLGDVIHRVFEDISKGIISEGDIRERAGKLLSAKSTVKDKNERFLSVIEKDISLLKEKGIWHDVIMPRKDSFSELPFILESEDTVYTGRIDRVIKENGMYNVYDYKTFPVEEKEIAHLLKGYSFQLGIYNKAVRELFKVKDVKSYIVFSHIGEIKEVS